MPAGGGWMKAEGQLSEIDFLDLLVAHWRESFTGAIRIENDAIIKIVYFREGDLLSASTNDRADSLGEILLRHGKVSREQLKQGTSKRREDESLGEALLGMGFLTRRELLWARRAQLVGAIRSVLEWKSGEYNIIADYVPRREEGPPFPFSQVLLEVVLTRADRDPIDRELELGSLVLEKSETFDEAYGQLGLNEEADGIVRLIDGRRSAVRVAVASDADRFNVFKLLVALKRLGLLRVPGETEVVEEVEALPLSPEAPLEDQAEAEAVAGEKSPPLLPPAEQPLKGVAPATEPPKRGGGGIRTALMLLLAVVLLGAAVWLVMVIRKDVPLAKQAPKASATPFTVASATPLPIVVESTPLPTPEIVTLSPAPEVVPPLVAEEVPAPLAASAEPAATGEDPAPAGEGADPLRARYDAMATEFARNVQAPYAIQFGIFCRTESISNALAADGANVWFVPAIFRGQACYRAYWGKFEERTAAEEAMPRLPEPLREGTRPAVVATGRR
jgi:hypothetical protein